MNKEQFFRGLERLRGETFTDEEVEKVIDVLGPILICNGLVIRTYEEVNKMETEKEEPKRLYRVSSININNGLSTYSRIRDLTEPEAVKWYKEYVPESYEKKDGLLYKKEGEWVPYEGNY